MTAAYTVKDGLVHDVVTSLLETEGGALFVGTAGGLTIRRNKHFVAWEKNGLLKSKLILVLHQAGDGTTWVGTERGLHLINTDSSVTSLYAPQDLPVDSVHVLLEENGITWIGTNGGGVLKYQAGRFASVPQATRACNEQVLSLYRLNDSHLWWGPMAVGSVYWTTRGVARDWQQLQPQFSGR